MSIKRSIFCFLASVVALVYLSMASAQLELHVDGEPAVLRGQLKSIEYWPDRRVVRINSVHDDFRCMAADGTSTLPVASAEDFKLVLDQVNPETEPEAVYLISDAVGSVDLDLANEVLQIVTTDPPDTDVDPDLRLRCAPFRESFWESDFSDLVELDSDAPEFASAGETFRITLTVTNSSKSIVATNIQVILNSSIEPDRYALLDADGSELLELPQITDNIWTIPSLWPVESNSITLETKYTAPIDGSGVTLEIVDVTACDRTGTEEGTDVCKKSLATGNPSLVTVVDTGT